MVEVLTPAPGTLPVDEPAALAYYAVAVAVAAVAVAAAAEASWLAVPVTKKVEGPSRLEPDVLLLGPMCPVCPKMMANLKLQLVLISAGYLLAQLLNLLVNWW